MSVQLQNKLMDYAPEPPAKVWDAIEASLDEGSTALSHRLYTFETSPPSRIWNKIESALKKNNPPAKEIPFYQQHKKTLQYSAAAVLLVAVLALSFLISQKTRSDRIASNPAINQPQQDKANSQPVVPISQSESTALYTENKDYNNNQISFIEEKKTLLKQLRPRLQLGSVVLTNHFIPKMAPTKRTVDQNAPAEKYIIYSDDNGNVLRLSKKLFDFFSCAQEETTCQQRMQQLQQQFAFTSLTSDFPSLLEMLQKLKENQ